MGEVIVLDIMKNESMSKHTTFGIGGRVGLFVRTDEIKHVLSFLYKSENVRVIGLGSNTLWTDYDTGMVVINYVASDIYIDHGMIVCSAGATISALLKFCVEHGIKGYEFLAGIPSTIAGAVKGNAGSPTQAIGDYVLAISGLVVENTNLAGTELFFDKIRTLAYELNGGKKHDDTKLSKTGHKTNKEKSTHELTNNIKSIKKISILRKKLLFSYRKSNINDNFFITSVFLKCDFGDGEQIKKEIKNQINKKIATQPLDKKSAGSVFKRSQKIVPALVFEQMGFKGTRCGDAVVSSKHSGFIINEGKASARDVLLLMSHLADSVLDRFAVKLDSEIKYFD